MNSGREINQGTTRSGNSEAGTWRARFESIGSVLPERRVQSREVVAACKLHPVMDLEGVTGIVERRVCSGEQDSLWLASEAAKDCLSRSKYKASELDMILFCGIGKFNPGREQFRLEPSQAVMIRDAIGAKGVMAFDVGNACAGMMTGVHIANQYIQVGAARSVMVVSGEYISHLATTAQRSVDTPHHPESASLTLGDAGAAVILERAELAEPGIESSVFTTLSEHVDLCTGMPCEDAIGWKMNTRAKEIHEEAIKATPLVMQTALKTAGKHLEDVDFVICHQTSARAIQRCAGIVGAYLESTRAEWVVTVDRFGNTASTTHIAALHHLIKEGKLRNGQRVLFAVQASGLVVGAIVVVIDGLGGDNAGSN